MPRSNFENLRVYRLSEETADIIWDIAMAWNNFAKDTVGKQIVRAADSIGANIAEGDGRGSYQEHRRYVRIARASLNETKHWLRRAFKRNLLTADQVKALKPMLGRACPSLECLLEVDRAETARACRLQPN
jgi:four helix bundle protein